MKQGFSLIEILISLTILGIIAAVVVSAFIKAESREALSLEAGKVLSLLSAARAQTLSGKDSAVFGVHFEEDQAVLFKGSVYTAGVAANIGHRFHGAVILSSIALSGGGTDVKFDKLTGATLQSGTVTLALRRDASATKVITISGTGVASSN